MPKSGCPGHPWMVVGTQLPTPFPSSSRREHPIGWVAREHRAPNGVLETTCYQSPAALLPFLNSATIVSSFRAEFRRASRSPL